MAIRLPNPFHRSFLKCLSVERPHEIMQASDLVERLAGSASGVEFGGEEPRARRAAHERFAAFLRVSGES